MKLHRPINIVLLCLALAACAGPSRRETLQMPYDDRIKLASIYMQGGQTDKAVPLLEDAAIQDEDRPEAWAMLGELYWLKEDFSTSSRHLKKALKAGGEDPVVLNNLAWVESAGGKTDKALSYSDRAIAMDPAPLYPYLETRARILVKLERYEEAQADARAALDLTPEYDTKMREGLEELLEEIAGKSNH